MNSMDEMMQAFNTTAEECATTVISAESNGSLRLSQTFGVIVPKASDKIVVDISIVTKIRSLCVEAHQWKFPVAETLLSVASLFLGAFFSAVLSKIPYELSGLAIFFYNICPLAGVGCGVAYFFCRKRDTTDVANLAKQIESCLCDINTDVSEG